MTTAQLDFTGQVITPTLDYFPIRPPATPNPSNPTAPYGIAIQAWETQDFLGDVFLCEDVVTGANHPGIPGDILSAHMYSSAETIIQWVSDHPGSQDSCGIIVRYSPYGNFPDYISSLSYGVRLSIEAGAGYGRVVDATAYAPVHGRAGTPVIIKGRTRTRAMKTSNQLKAFLSLGALSLLTATLGSATTGCVADRPSRNGVYDENQYIRKDWLVRAGDSANPDYGWMLKATITDASEPNVFGDANVYQLFAGAHSDGELVHFLVTSDNLAMVDNRQISSDPSVGVLGETVNAWPITNVDLKYQINLDGEKSNLYQENQELDWQVRQWVKVNLDKNNMADLAPLGSYVTANVAKCVAGEGTATLVPNSFIVDEPHDYMEWTVQISMPINWSDSTCVESYGAMGLAAQKLDRQYETVNLKYSMVRANPNPLAKQKMFSVDQNGVGGPDVPAARGRREGSHPPHVQPVPLLYVEHRSERRTRRLEPAGRAARYSQVSALVLRVGLPGSVQERLHEHEPPGGRVTAPGGDPDDPGRNQSAPHSRRTS